MIKCGTIAAVVIAGSAAGTATLVSNAPGTEGVPAGGQAAIEQSISARGTRPEVTIVDTFAPSVGDQPRRGDRPEYDLAPLAMAAPGGEGDGLRRGTR